MQYYFHTFGDVIGHSGWHADAQVDIGTIEDVLCDPLGEFIFASFLVGTHGVFSMQLV
jgi:hypothetical protein